MNGTVMAAIISVAGSIVVASLSFFLTKWHERKAEWQRRKVQHYTDLLSSLSDLAVDGADKNEANRSFAHAVNTVGLVAPQYVISALMAFHRHVCWPSPDASVEKHDELLRGLPLAIRRDIGLSAKDDATTFDFHLIGSAPPRHRDKVGRA